jgi:hypothetical protein
VVSKLWLSMLSDMDESWMSKGHCKQVPGSTLVGGVSNFVPIILCSSLKSALASGKTQDPVFLGENPNVHNDFSSSIHSLYILIWRFPKWVPPNHPFIRPAWWVGVPTWLKNYFFFCAVSCRRWQNQVALFWEEPPNGRRWGKFGNSDNRRV